MAPQVITTDFESAHGREPRGKNSWTFLVGSEPFRFEGKYFEGRRVAIERATALNANEIRVLPFKDALSIVPTAAAAPAPAPVMTRPPAIVNISTDATLPPVRIATKVAPDVPVDVEKCEHVQLYVDDKDVGCGYHGFIVMAKGDSFVRLFCYYRLATIVVATKYFNKHAKVIRTGPATRERIAATIRRHLKWADDANANAGHRVAHDGGACVTQALELLAA
jgi:hypothetical protein